MSTETIHPCYCGKLFTSPSALIQHQQSHQPSQLHCCPHCYKPFTSTSALLQHQETHTTVPPNTTTKMPPAYTHLCPHCDKRFSSASALHQHTKASHQRPEQPTWTCHQCGKPFTSAPALLQHMEMHTAERTCRCECGRRFKNADAMEAHRRSSKVHMDVGARFLGYAEKAHREVEGDGGRLLRYEDDEEEEEGEVGDSDVVVNQEVVEIGGMQYDRFSETAIGSSGITTEHLDSCQQSRVRFANDPAKTRGGDIDGAVEKMDLPLDVVAGLKRLLRFVKERSGAMDGDDVNPEKRERWTSAVTGVSGGGGSDVTMCDEECGWCGECGDEYKP